MYIAVKGIGIKYILLVKRARKSKTSVQFLKRFLEKLKLDICLTQLKYSIKITLFDGHEASV